MKSPSKKRKLLRAPIDVIEIFSTDEGEGTDDGDGTDEDVTKGKEKGKGKAKANSEGEGQSEAEVEGEVEWGPMTSDDVIELSSDEE